MVSVHILFKKNVKLFYRVAVIILQTYLQCVRFSFSTTSPAFSFLYNLTIFYFSCLHKCIVIVHHNLNLHCPNTDVEHHFMYLFAICIIFDGMPHQVFCLFSNYVFEGFFFFLLLSFKYSLHILD